MILLREIEKTDIDSLGRFANIPGFIFLSGDRDDLEKKIRASIRSFGKETKSKSESQYVFVAENLENGQILGTSMIGGQHGSEEAPHFYFQLGSEEKYSTTINTGFIHGTIELKIDTDGPSEIGGLITDPNFRDQSVRLGRQISFVRFLYLALNRELFREKIVAELLPPINKRGQSPLWEAIGRRFTNMDYNEADRLCQQNKEFILSLFPTGKIYTSFFGAEARNAIGKVGKKTEPVVHMLSKIGFQFLNQVDPFDGGPHYWAEVEKLLPVKNLAFYRYEPNPKAGGTVDSEGLLAKHPSGERFEAVSVKARVTDQTLSIANGESSKVEKALGLKPSDQVAFTPYY